MSPSSRRSSIDSKAKSLLSHLHLKAPSLDRGALVRRQLAHFETLAMEREERSATPAPRHRPTVLTGDGRPSLRERWSRMRSAHSSNVAREPIARPGTPVPASPAAIDTTTTPLPPQSRSSSSSSSSPSRYSPMMATMPYIGAGASPRTPRAAPSLESIPEAAHCCPPAPRKPQVTASRLSSPLPPLPLGSLQRQPARRGLRRSLASSAATSSSSGSGSGSSSPSSGSHDDYDNDFFAGWLGFVEEELRLSPYEESDYGFEDLVDMLGEAAGEWAPATPDISPCSSPAPETENVDDAIPALIEMVERAADEWVPSI